MILEIEFLISSGVVEPVGHKPGVARDRQEVAVTVSWSCLAYSLKSYFLFMSVCVPACSYVHSVCEVFTEARVGIRSLELAFQAVVSCHV